MASEAVLGTVWCSVKDDVGPGSEGKRREGSEKEGEKRVGEKREIKGREGWLTRERERGELII